MAEIIDLTESNDVAREDNQQILSAKVIGKPKALKRHRHGKKGHYYNPSEREQRIFRHKVFQQMSVTASSLPFFDTTEPLSLKVIFRFRRPNNHFVGNKRGNPLKKEFQSSIHRCKVDTDNLIKFVMDSLIGVAYKDDSQVTHISALRLYKNDNLDCDESTEVTIKTFTEVELANIVNTEN